MAGDERVFVAGHNGLVGSALVRELTARGYGRLLTRTRSELDLRDQRAVADFFRKERPEVVVLAAAKVGGIHANDLLIFPPDGLTPEQLLVDLAQAGWQGRTVVDARRYCLRALPIDYLAICTALSPHYTLA